MDDGGRLEATIERMRRTRERGDYANLLQGLRAYRLNTRYGAGVIDHAATEAGIPRSTLYEYRAVWDFYWQVLDGTQLSAWRIMRWFPYLTYTHLRDALRLEDVTDALLAFVAAADGDERYPSFSESLPMTSEAFGLYVGALLGKEPPRKPAYHKRGSLLEVLSDFARWSRNASGKQVELKLWWVD